MFWLIRTDSFKIPRFKDRQFQIFFFLTYIHPWKICNHGNGKNLDRPSCESCYAAGLHHPSSLHVWPPCTKLLWASYPSQIYTDGPPCAQLNCLDTELAKISAKGCFPSGLKEWAHRHGPDMWAKVKPTKDAKSFLSREESKLLHQYIAFTCGLGF